MQTKSSPLISTVIPTYRRPHLLKRAILSVLNQTEPSFQVCVFDNASGDDTQRVVAELAARDSRIKYHCHKKNIGGFENFQYALSHVATPYFSILADDDILLPGFFDKAIQGLSSNPEAIFWAGLTVRMSGDGTVYDAKAELWPHEGLYTPPQGLLEMTRGKAPNLTGLLFRREVVERVGLLDANVGAPADLDYMLRIAAQFAFFVSKYPVAIYLLNPDSFSEQGPFSAFWPGWLKMIGNLSTMESLDNAVRLHMEDELNTDGRRMLFRRGAGALAMGRLDFTRQAARVLRDHYRNPLHAGLLQAATVLCTGFPLAQRIYTTAYRAAVRRSLRQRTDLQQRYGYLAKLL